MIPWKSDYVQWAKSYPTPRQRLWMAKGSSYKLVLEGSFWSQASNSRKATGEIQSRLLKRWSETTMAAFGCELEMKLFLMTRAIVASQDVSKTS
tara:strand:+ start:208 stop:489 length:282 start_codon:yes stop_codon:yes gene_type:complete